MKVVWTDRAKLRLGKIHAAVSEEAPAVADDLVRRLVERSKQLELVALSGRKVPEFDREDIRELNVRPYRIIYRVGDQIALALGH